MAARELTLTLKFDRPTRDAVGFFIAELRAKLDQTTDQEEREMILAKAVAVLAGHLIARTARVT